MDLHSSAHAVNKNIISDLEHTFSESLHIQDDRKSEHASEENDICDEAEEKLSGSFKQQDTKLDMKCLKKSATFPIADTMLSSSSSDEEVGTSFKDSPSEQSVRQTLSHSLSLPAPLKLISAMKGSREKHGGSPTKLTVKWAPDVYDPIPTLVSHTVKSRKQSKSRKKKAEKKNGKKGQKGNSSRGSSGKDKMQFRKSGGASDLFYKSLDSCEEVFETSTEFDALDVRSQDPYCGTSFLKKSVTEVHFSVAEAQ